MTRAYLDHNATSPVRPETAKAMAEALAETGNPSSVHAEGRRAHARLESARDMIARRLGTDRENVVFTSGATEAINLALIGGAAAGAAGRVLVSAIEHDATQAAAWVVTGKKGAAPEVIPVTRDGVVDLERLEAMLARKDAVPALVAVMHANNETGVIQPIRAIAKLVHDAGGRLLVDAAQSFGKIGVSMEMLGVDYLAVSAHKLGGPAGVGALVAATGAPLLRREHGGGQERSRRAGTENLPGIAGFAAAADAACAALADFDELSELRDGLEARVTEARDDVRIWGADAERLANTSCISLPGLAAETQVMALDLAGVAVSAGAACSSGKVKPSHVLAAMGADPSHASSAIRVSLGWNTTETDVERFLTAYLEAADRAVGSAARAPEPAPAA